MGKSIQIVDNLNAFGDCRTNFFKFGITDKRRESAPVGGGSPWAAPGIAACPDKRTRKRVYEYQASKP
jgi:hypothetical protein